MAARAAAWLISARSAAGCMLLSPDYPIIIEGAQTEDLPEVSAFFHGIAAELDIPLLDADEEAAA